MAIKRNKYYSHRGKIFNRCGASDAHCSWCTELNMHMGHEAPITVDAAEQRSSSEATPGGGGDGSACSARRYSVATSLASTGIARGSLWGHENTREIIRTDYCHVHMRNDGGILV